jgi:hypothetical protein
MLLPAALSYGCSDSMVVTRGTMGGTRNNPYPCMFGALSNTDPWERALLRGNITQPEKCPYLVDGVAVSITFATQVTAPKETTHPANFLDFTGLKSYYNGHPVASSQTQYWNDHPTITT